MTKTNICQNPKCNKEISPKRVKHNAKYCCTACGKAGNKRISGYLSSKVQLSHTTKGAIGELTVCVHLLKKGFEVFRATSPACSCDLVLLYKGKPFRIEVKLNYQHYKHKTLSLAPKDKGKSDIVAWVFYGGKIVYDPPLSALKTAQRQS